MQPRTRSVFTFTTTALCALVAIMMLAGFAQAAPRDNNHDGISDRWERRHHLSLHVNQAKRDQDSDGVRNRCEFQAGTDPRSNDSDDDGTSDGQEDADHDQVDNGNESTEGTNCSRKDSNHDGVNDGKEDKDDDSLNNQSEDLTGNDPTNPDTNGNGVKDGAEHNGTIVSFSGGILTIQPTVGDPVSGTLAANVEITCKTESEHEVDHHGQQGHSSGSAASEDGGQHGDDNSGSDKSGQHGDDNPGTGTTHDGLPDDNGNDVADSEEGDTDNICTTADLVAGAVIHEAELENGAFKKIEILK